MFTVDKTIHFCVPRILSEFHYKFLITLVYICLEIKKVYLPVFFVSAGSLRLFIALEIPTTVPKPDKIVPIKYKQPTMESVFELANVNDTST